MRPIGMHQHAMDIALDRIGIDDKLGEALAEILRHQERADLDADQQAVAVEHDVLDVADARRRRKAPFADAGRVAQRRQFAPGLAAVLADIKMRRQRADADHVAARKLAGARRPQVHVVEAVEHPGPGQAAVVALRGAKTVGRGIQSAVVGRRDGADRAAAERAVLDDPAVRGAFEHDDAVDRAYEHGVRGGAAALRIRSAVGKQDHRSIPCNVHIAFAPTIAHQL